MSSDRTTFRDVRVKPHSYRSHNPSEIIDIATDPELGPQEQLEQAKAALKFIEAGRLLDMAKATFEFFFKLDRDEKELFTRRNPDLLRWAGAWGAATEATSSLQEWREKARTEFSDANGVPTDPPPFQRDPIPDRRDSLFDDMSSRRRSYRNWTPGEFRDILEMGKIELTRGRARRLEWRTAEIRETIEFPVEIGADEIARLLMNRVEAGRFEPVLAETHTFFMPLDKDERELFAARNPGIIMWMDVWAKMNHQQNGEDSLLVELPTLKEERTG